MAEAKAPAFLNVKPGDYVIIQAEQRVALEPDANWWMGQVVFCEGGARDPRVNTMFQIANVDDGCILWVNADEVTHVVRSFDDLTLNA
ncbi:DUF3104 domain-containing protein [Synechococcus sp. MU1655]|uniref:DUF3104 domain-containing protein n=1 Tax=Synechococcus sp. MU1655 TaxID=2508355 RepID=UPI0020275EA5|nr:DUF3104 domain-containing protein [Synechococcus sp. MU1655]